MKNTIGRNIRRTACLVSLLALSGAGVSQAALIADVRTDYVYLTPNGTTTISQNSGKGLNSTVVGSGYWNYLFSGVVANAASAEYYQKTGDYGWNPVQQQVYGGYGNTANTGWSKVSLLPIFGGTTASDEVWWHPGGTSSNNATDYGDTIIRWTSNMAGTIDLVGDARLGDSYFYVRKNGSPLFSYTTHNTTATFGTIGTPLTTTVAIGDKIDFVLMSRPGSTGGGSSFLSAQIYAIPEPSAALLGGLGMLALLRRRRGSC